MNWAEENVPAVRMFPDYAGTVLWFDGPVDYTECSLNGPENRLVRKRERPKG